MKPLSYSVSSLAEGHHSDTCILSHGPLLAPRQLCPHPCPTHQKHHDGTSPQPLLSPLSRDICQTHTFCGTRTGAPQRFPAPRLARSQPMSSAPQLTAASARAPQAAAVICVLSVLCPPSPRLCPSLGISEGCLAGSSC